METNSTLTQMWDTRPPRIPEKQGGKAVIAGVCEGFGARYRIDPVLLRVIWLAGFLLLDGALLLYLLCWMVMPRFGMTTSPWRAIATPKDQLDPAEVKERDTGWILLVFIIFFMLGTFADASIHSLRALVTFALFGIGWYLLHQRTPQPPAGLLPAPAQRTVDGSHRWEPSANPGTSSAGDGVGTSHLTVPEGYPHPAAGRTTPPAWDPLGTAPELWHLPDPGAPDPQPALQPERNRSLWFWVPVALLLSAATFTVIAMADSLRFYSFHSGDLAGFGDTSVTVEDVDMLPPMHRVAGTLELDLSRIAPLDEEKTIELGNYVGGIDIRLPDNVPVRAECAVGLGTANCPDGVVNEGGDGQLLTIDARNFIGTVTVR